jgi:hypothetical protein
MNKEEYLKRNITIVKVKDGVNIKIYKEDK